MMMKMTRSNLLALDTWSMDTASSRDWKMSGSRWWKVSKQTSGR